jgi:DNA-binding LacI/PurR family transcriptional regulator
MKRVRPPSRPVRDPKLRRDSPHGTATGAARPVTMNDVAAAAGVAQSTVSRVLNDSASSVRVSPQTRDRVLAVAEQLGYRPHPIARALRGAPTMLLGVIVRDINDPFFAGAIEAVSKEAGARGYSVVLGHARAAADTALALTAVLEDRHCDAIVLFGDFRGERRLLEDLRRTEARVVGLWHGSTRDRPFGTVGVDNRAGIHDALEHLLALGHRAIAYVGADSLGDMQERQSAYAEYASTGRLYSPPGFVQIVANTFAGGEDALATLLAEHRAPTAIVAATDTLALGLLHGAYERGIAVPGALSVAGFDDIAMASVSVPSLTTVRMPIAEIVAAGIELGVGEESAGGEGAPRLVFKPTLIVRGSTGPVDPGAA